MKVAESKSVATPAKANSSFFNKGADTALLTDSASETPFFNKQTNNPFFVQTKLTIGQPNDKYEQEADHIADKVVQRSAIAPLNNSITPFVQTKCAACEDEEKLQKKEDKEEGDLLEGQLRRKPIFDSNADPDELEGGLGVQKKCAHCEEEEKHISRKGEDSSVEMKSSSVETRLSQSKGTGRQMPEHTCVRRWKLLLVPIFLVYVFMITAMLRK
jgi:bacterioferritin-associated ferredoxin